MTRKGDNDPAFVKLEEMTDADIRWNVERLRNEAKGALEHADALSRFGKKKRFSNGEVRNEQK